MPVGCREFEIFISLTIATIIFRKSASKLSHLCYFYIVLFFFVRTAEMEFVSLEVLKLEKQIAEKQVSIKKFAKNILVSKSWDWVLSSASAHARRRTSIKRRRLKVKRAKSAVDKFYEGNYFHSDVLRSFLLSFTLYFFVVQFVTFFYTVKPLSCNLIWTIKCKLYSFLNSFEIHLKIH